jgi:hypothetical protein
MLTTLKPNAPRGFDLMIGQWQVKHRQLKQRLTGCTQWIEFIGQSSTIKSLGGFGNLEDNQLNFHKCSFSAVALRSFDPQLKNSLYGG